MKCIALLYAALCIKDHVVWLETWKWWHFGKSEEKSYRNCLISSKWDQIKHCKDEWEEEDGLVFKQARHESIQSQAINVLQCKTAGLCVCGNTTSSNRWSIQANNCLIISGPNIKKLNNLANKSSIKGIMIFVQSLEGGGRHFPVFRKCEDSLLNKRPQIR